MTLLIRMSINIVDKPYSPNGLRMILLSVFHSVAGYAIVRELIKPNGVVQSWGQKENFKTVLPKSLFSGVISKLYSLTSREKAAMSNGNK